MLSRRLALAGASLLLSLNVAHGEAILPREEGNMLVEHIGQSGILLAEDSARRYRCSVVLQDTYAASVWAMKMVSGDLIEGYNKTQRMTFGMAVWLAMGLLDKQKAACTGIDPMPPGTKRPKQDS